MQGFTGKKGLFFMKTTRDSLKAELDRSAQLSRHPLFSGLIGSITSMMAGANCSYLTSAALEVEAAEGEEAEAEMIVYSAELIHQLETLDSPFQRAARLIAEANQSIDKGVADWAGKISRICGALTAAIAESNQPVSNFHSLTHAIDHFEAAYASYTEAGSPEFTAETIVFAFEGKRDVVHEAIDSIMTQLTALRKFSDDVYATETTQIGELPIAIGETRFPASITQLSFDDDPEAVDSNEELISELQKSLRRLYRQLAHGQFSATARQIADFCEAQPSSIAEIQGDYLDRLEALVCSIAESLNELPASEQLDHISTNEILDRLKANVSACNAADPKVSAAATTSNKLFIFCIPIIGEKARVQELRLQCQELVKRVLAKIVEREALQAGYTFHPTVSGWLIEKQIAELPKLPFDDLKDEASCVDTSSPIEEEDAAAEAVVGHA